MNFRTFFKITLFTALLITSFSSISNAETTTYKCPEGPMCIDQRINFGTVQIKCTDVNGDVLSDWICEYELEYSCKNTMTGQVEKGGFNPLSTNLCNKLCGPCKEGWK